MSLARTNTFSKLIFKNRSILFTAVRNHWNKDYKPREFPKTPAERAAAAKKYNLLLEDYKPYPDDGAGLGDYPNLPMISGDAKDPNYPYDNPELKRNFDEPMHADCDLIGEDRYDVSGRLRNSLPVYFAQFFLWMALMGGLTLFFEDKKLFLAIAAKQYPNDGEKHYTFPTNEGEEHHH